MPYKQAPLQCYLSGVTQGVVVVIHCRGSIASRADAACFQRIVQRAVHDGKDVVLDFGRVTAVRPDGVRVLVFLYLHSRAFGSQVCMARVRKPLQQELATANVASLFEMYSGVEEAMLSLGGRAA